MTGEDLMTLKSIMGGTSLSPFEATTIAQREGKRINGATATALVLSGGAILLGAAAWIGSSMYTAAKNKGNERAIDLLATQAINERNERVNQAPRLVDYVNVQTGAYAGAGAASNALAQAEAQIVSNALTGRMQTCPTPVALYSAPQPCGCPCSCNG